MALGEAMPTVRCTSWPYLISMVLRNTTEREFSKKKKWRWSVEGGYTLSSVFHPCI